MRSPLYPAAAFSFGVYALIAAAVLANVTWLFIGLLAIACCMADLLGALGFGARRVFVDARDCLLLLAVYLVLCVFKPTLPDAPHELD